MDNFVSTDIATIVPANRINGSRSAQYQHDLEMDNSSDEPLVYRDAALLALHRIFFHMLYLHLWSARLILWTTSHVFNIIQPRTTSFCSSLTTRLHDLRARLCQRIPHSTVNHQQNTWITWALRLAMKPMQTYQKMKRIIAFLDRVSQTDIFMLQHQKTDGGGDSTIEVEGSSTLELVRYADEHFGIVDNGLFIQEERSLQSLSPSTNTAGVHDEDSSQTSKVTKSDVDHYTSTSKRPTNARKPSSESSRCMACNEVNPQHIVRRRKIPEPKLVSHHQSAASKSIKSSIPIGRRGKQ